MTFIYVDLYFQNKVFFCGFLKQITFVSKTHRILVFGTMLSN